MNISDLINSGLLVLDVEKHGEDKANELFRRKVTPSFVNNLHDVVRHVGPLEIWDMYRTISRSVNHLNLYVEDEATGEHSFSLLHNGHSYYTINRVLETSL